MINFIFAFGNNYANVVISSLNGDKPIKALFVGVDVIFGCYITSIAMTTQHIINGRRLIGTRVGLQVGGAVLMQTAQQMHVEIIAFVAPLSAHFALERIVVVMATHVQRVHHLVPENNVAVGTGSLLGLVISGCLSGSGGGDRILLCGAQVQWNKVSFGIGWRVGKRRRGESR